MSKTIDGHKLIKGIGTIILYLVLTIVLQIPFVFLIKKELISSELSTLLVYAMLAIIFIIIFRKDLIKDFKDFKKNGKKIFFTTVKFWLIGFIIMFISAIFINALPIRGNTNQETNIALLKSSPAIEIALACFLAPIIEETVFRLSFKKFSTNKWIYAFVTGILFASIHLISSIDGVKDLIMLIYIIPFGALGVTFGLAYHKTNNIYGTLLVHSLHNTISILQLLLIGGIIL